MTIREVHIHRADGKPGDTVTPVLIRIQDALADAIWEACPGGTVDALLSALFARKASQFRVRFPQEADR